MVEQAQMPFLLVQGQLTVNGGAGNDTINVSSGLGDSVDGGAGNDLIIISVDGNLTATDTYAGGEGTDTLAFTTTVTDAAATFAAFSGFEVRFSDALSLQLQPMHSLFKP